MKGSDYVLLAKKKYVSGVRARTLAKSRKRFRKFEPPPFEKDGYSFALYCDMKRYERQGKYLDRHGPLLLLPKIKRCDAPASLVTFFLWCVLLGTAGEEAFSIIGYRS